MQPVHITTEFVSLNPAHDEVYSIQLYVIRFVSDLQHVRCFFWVLRMRFPQPIKLTDDITKILLEVALNTITLTSIYLFCPSI